MSLYKFILFINLNEKFKYEAHSYFNQNELLEFFNKNSWANFKFKGSITIFDTCI